MQRDRCIYTQTFSEQVPYTKSRFLFQHASISTCAIKRAFISAPANDRLGACDMRQRSHSTNNHWMVLAQIQHTIGHILGRLFLFGIRHINHSCIKKKTTNVANACIVRTTLDQEQTPHSMCKVLSSRRANSYTQTRLVYKKEESCSRHACFCSSKHSMQLV